MLDKLRTVDTITQNNRSMLSEAVRRNDFFIDIALVVLVTALSFSLAYHPYFFGDELPPHRLAIQHNYSFSLIFQKLLAYKPRLISLSILAFLAKWQAERMVYTALLAGFMAWINIILFGIVRYLFKGGRGLAWLLIATVLTSRYGMMLYFDYSSGLVELLSTALLLSAFLLAWLAWRDDFKWWYAAGALIWAVMCIFAHERYVVGLLAAGFAIAIAEFAGSSAKRRIPVVGWALSLSIVPLLLFWTTNIAIGSSSLTTGTAGQEVKLGAETFWCALTYGYNVFFGGNYGHEWFWGHYNYLHPVGKIMGWGSAGCTVVLIALIVFRKGIAWHNRWMAASLATVAIALIAIASLPGTERQEARWMFPVGIFVAMSWIVLVKDAWRHVVIALTLVINLMYLLLGSHDSIANVYASREANSVAGSLQNLMPNGRNGIVVGNDADLWIIGGGALIDMGPRQGDTFSRINLKSTVFIDPFQTGRIYDPAHYDFGLVFTGYDPHMIAHYRVVSASTAFVLAGVLDVDKFGLPLNNIVIGNRKNWTDWKWSVHLDQIDGATQLRPGASGFRGVSAAILDGRLLVYNVRGKQSARVPMRLQVNWHTKQDNRFLSAMIQVVYPGETWKSYSTLLSAPPGADIGYVYATLHDGAQGVVELKSVELK